MKAFFPFFYLGGTGGSPTPGHSQAGQQPTVGGGGGDSPTHVKNLSVNIPHKSEPVKSTSVGQVGLPQLPHSPYRGPGSTYMQLQQQPIYGGGQTFMQQQQHYHVSPQRLVQSILQYYKHYGWSVRLDIRKLRVLRDSFSRIFKGIFQSQCLGNVL